ncbi:MAG: hypothetical protein ACOYLH_08040 [Flavobacteriales bacterium]
MYQPLCSYARFHIRRLFNSSHTFQRGMQLAGLFNYAQLGRTQIALFNFADTLTEGSIVIFSYVKKDTTNWNCPMTMKISRKSISERVFINSTIYSKSATNRISMNRMNIRSDID